MIADEEVVVLVDVWDGVCRMVKLSVAYVQSGECGAGGVVVLGR